MDWLIAALAAVIGYLLGAISFARVIYRLVAPQEELTGMEMPVPNSDEKMNVETFGGMTISMKLGAKYGGLTSLCDMLKVTIPTLVFMLLYPKGYYHLIVAAMGLVGHNWPIYYGFKGGRGLSAIYGGFLAIDFFGSLITSLVGMFFCLIVLKNVLISYLAGLWLMIPWIWFFKRDWPYVAYVVFCNLMFVVAMIPEMKKIAEYQRRGEAGDFQDAMSATPMGKMIKKMGERIGLFQD